MIPVINRKAEFIHVDPYDQPGVLMHLKYTVLWKIWPAMVFFTGIAIALVLINELIVSVNMAISPTMLTVLGTVLGFTISYRTSSAYERYIEGRKLWQQVQSSTRLMARLVWFHVPNQTLATLPEDKEEKARDAAKAMLEKKTMLNLLEAYSVSLKHYLRGETGIHYEDLYHLVLFLPKYHLPNSTPIYRQSLHGEPVSSSMSRSPSTETSKILETPLQTPMLELDQLDHGVRFRGREGTTDTEKTAHPVGPRFPDKPLLPANNPPPFHIIDDLFPALRPLWTLFKFGRRRVNAMLDSEEGERKKRRRKHKKEVYTGQNIPVELNLHMSSWIAALQQRKVLDPATNTALLNANMMLADALAGLERVLTTPIPFAYAIHLKHTAYLYLLFLPFQILGTLKFVTIPAVFIASFIFIGFLELGDQIEQPLGYDAGDLDLGSFCDNIRKELHEMAAMPPYDSDAFFFGECNEPLAPHDTRSAAELLESKITVDDVESSLRAGHDKHTHMTRSFTEAARTSIARESQQRNRSKVRMSVFSPKHKNDSMV